MLTPKIRFNGFDEPWERRYFSDHVFVSKLKNKYGIFGARDVLSVSGDHGVVNQIELQGRSFAGSDLTPYGVVETGDIVYTRSPLKDSPYGIIKTSRQPTGIVSVLYAIYKANIDTNPYFVETYFSDNTRLNKYLSSLVNIGAKNTMLISSEGALKGLVTFPKEPEQNKLVEMFDEVQSVIKLNKQRLESLQRLKAYMQQELFPQGNMRLPTLRFEGFKGEWTNERLETICSIQTGRLDANAMVENGQYDFYTSGVKKYKIDTPAFTGPAITIAGNGSSLGYMHIADGQFNAYQRTYVLDHFKVNRTFVFHSMSRVFPKRIVAEVRASNIPYIVLPMLTKLKIALPTESAEQELIAHYFTALDKLIELQTQKSELVEKLKQYMLINMFAS